MEGGGRHGRSDLRDHRRRPRRDGAGAAAGPRRRAGDRAGEARRLPARLPRRHRAPVHPGSCWTSWASAERFAALPQHRSHRSSCRSAGREPFIVGRLLARCRSSTRTSRWCRNGICSTCWPTRRGRSPSFTLRMRHRGHRPRPRERGRVTGVRYRTRRRRQRGAAGHADRGLRRPPLDRPRRPRLRPREFPVPMDVLVVPAAPRSARRRGRRGQRRRRAGSRSLIDRGDYWQCAVLIREGRRRRGCARPGSTAFWPTWRTPCPWLADRVGRSRSWDEVKLLDVRLDRLRRWHAPACCASATRRTPCRRSAASASTSPCRTPSPPRPLLAGPLRRGTVTPANLAAVRARRLVPTVAVQALQRLLHRGLIAPTLAGRRIGPPAPVLALLRRSHSFRSCRRTSSASASGPNTRRRTPVAFPRD